MSTYNTSVEFTIGASHSMENEDLESTPMTITLVEIREPIWIQFIEVTN